MNPGDLITLSLCLGAAVLATFTYVAFWRDHDPLEVGEDLWRDEAGLPPIDRGK